MVRRKEKTEVRAGKGRKPEKRVEEEILSLSRFPAENPNPIIRLSKEGKILYGNPAAAPVLDEWKCKVGRLAPKKWRQRVAEVYGSSLKKEPEDKIGDRTFAFTLAPIKGAGYVNIYGRDITERKKAEEEILRAKNEWERTFESVPDLIAILDNEHRIVRANKAMAERLGVSPEECVGLNCFECVHKLKGPPSFCPHSLTMADGKEHIAEVHEDNLGGDFLVSTTPLSNQQGQIIGSVHVARDITQRKRIEQALRESEERYRQIIETTEEGVWMSTPEGMATFVNQKMADLLGYAREEIIGKTGLDFLAQGQEKIVMQTREGLKKGERIQREYQFRRKDGTTLWTLASASPILDKNGQHIANLAMHTDITERKKAEEALRQSERNFGSLAANAPDVIMRFDPNLRIRYLNPQVERATGIPVEKWIGKTSEEMGMPPKLCELWNDVFHKAEFSKELQQVEFDFSSSDGTRTYSLRVVPEFAEDGSLTSFLGISHDITDIKKAEEELRQSEAKYRSLFANMIVGYAYHKMVFDNSGNPIDYVFLEINDAFEKLTGLSRASVIGKKATEAIPGLEKDPANWINRYGKVVLTGEPVKFESFAEPLQKWYSVSAYSPEKGHFAATFEDITERRHAEEALRKAHEELEMRVEERTKELKDATEAVKAERKRFIDVLEKLPAYLVLLTPDYHVSYANKFFRERFGEDKGRRCFEYLFDRSEPCEICETYKTLKKMGPLEWEWTGPDGHNYYIFDSPFTDVDGSTLIMEVGIDITERKKAEEALRKAHEELETRVDERTKDLKEATWKLQAEVSERKKTEQLLRESQTDLTHAQAVAKTGSWRLDVRRNELQWSDESYRMFGIPKGTPMTYETFLITVHPDDRGYVDRKWQAAIRGEPYDIEHRIIVNGNIKWVREKAELEVDEQGSLMGGFGTVQDMTERKQIENALREARDYLENLLNYASAPIIVWDSEFKITRFNRAFEHLSGYKAEEVVGKDLSILFPEESREESLREIQHTLAGEYWESMEIPILRKDGDARTVLWNSANIYAQDGKTLMATIAQGIDITERKKLEEKLKKAERMAAIGETAAMVGHDLRNPLQATVGFISLAEELLQNIGCAPEEKQKIEEPLKAIKKQAQYMNKIVLDLQDYARPLEPELKETDLTNLINEIISSLQTPQTIETSISIPQDFPKVSVDSTLITRALTNLLRNAVEAMPEGGKLTIEVSQDHEGIYIKIRDTGIGIAEEDMPKLFTPLFTTKAKGQGFGLPVCKQIAEAHGGTIKAESQPGKGSTFTFTIPLDKSKREAEHQ